jgi:hypothetical protein
MLLIKNEYQLICIFIIVSLKIIVKNFFLRDFLAIFPV